MDSRAILIIAIAAAGALIFFLFFLSRLKKCPSDKIMVIYGKLRDENGRQISAKCIHGGAVFIWPFIQYYQFLDLTPIPVSIDLKNALSRRHIRINVSAVFTVGISTEPPVMQNAAERLLGLKPDEIRDLARDIIFGQLRLVIAATELEQIDTGRDMFLEQLSRNVEGEIRKIGLRLINVNLNDIN